MPVKSEPQVRPPRAYRLGLSGYPLGHSLSPRLHAAALASCGLEGEYRLHPVPPLPEGTAELKSLLDQVRRGELHGLNITIPHKQAVIAWLDELSPAARLIRAVNTIYRRGDRLAGENTDAPGFLADLERTGLVTGRTAGRKALVLGAGGSARAVVAALASQGWQVRVAARRFDQALELAASLNVRPPAVLTPLPLQAHALQGWQPHLIVNATPAGMAPKTDGCPWPEGLPLPAGSAVYDLVYNPPVTRLIEAARRRGLPASNGLGMLVEQAALAFEVWTGCTPDREAMFAAVRESIKQEVE